MRWLNVSEKYRLPATSNATSNGPFSNAAVAGPPSPAKPFSPLPTAVVITNSAIRPLLSPAQHKEAVRFPPRGHEEHEETCHSGEGRNPLLRGMASWSVGPG